LEKYLKKDVFCAIWDLFYDLRSFIYRLAISFLKFILPLKQVTYVQPLIVKKMERTPTKQTREECYTSPDFEMVEIEFEQNILQGGSGKTLDYYGEDY
jgi:hypothetical protein